MVADPPHSEPDASGAYGFSTVLRALGEAEGDQLKGEELVLAFGDRAFGAVMLVFALISTLPLPPGSTTVTGIPLVIMAVQLARGRERLWLPRRFLQASISRRAFKTGVAKVLPSVRFAERLTRPRLEYLVGQTGQRVVGLICCLLAVVLALPIPLGNMVPAIAVSLFSLGIMQRDGFAVVAGWIGVLASIGVLVAGWSIVVSIARASLRMIGVEF